MNRPPLSALVLTVFGIGLGLLMILEGLYARLFGIFLSGRGLMNVWLLLPRWSGSSPGDWVLPMVIIGTMWMGGLAVLWLGLSWGPWAVSALAIASLLFLGLGTLLGAAILICLVTPSCRRWVAALRSQHEH